MWNHLRQSHEDKLKKADVNQPSKQMKMDTFVINKTLIPLEERIARLAQSKISYLRNYLVKPLKIYFRLSM